MCLCTCERVCVSIDHEQIDKVVDKDMSFDKDFTNEDDISDVSEWALVFGGIYC